MSKKPIKIFVILTVMLLIFALCACNNKNNNINTGKDIQDPPYSYDYTVIKPILNAIPEDGKLNYICGTVWDTDYQPLKNADIYFGEDNEFVNKTDENGWFEFYFFDPYELTAENQISYLSLDNETYDSVAVVKKVYIRNADLHTNHIECFMVASKAEDNLDINQILLLREMQYLERQDIFLDIRIATDGVRLPEGYLHREQPVAASETSRCDYTLNDVTVYVNGKYYAISNSYGIGFDFLLIGMEITFEYEGFDFAVSLIEPPEKEDQDNNPTERNPDLLNDNTLIIQGLPMEGAKIFAYTQDVDILIK